MDSLMDFHSNRFFWEAGQLQLKLPKPCFLIHVFESAVGFMYFSLTGPLYDKPQVEVAILRF